METKDKVQALTERIIEECRRQGWTVKDVERLLVELDTETSRRIMQLEEELF